MGRRQLCQGRSESISINRGLNIGVRRGWCGVSPRHPSDISSIYSCFGISRPLSVCAIIAGLWYWRHQWSINTCVLSLKRVAYSIALLHIANSLGSRMNGRRERRRLALAWRRLSSLTLPDLIFCWRKVSTQLNYAPPARFCRKTRVRTSNCARASNKRTRTSSSLFCGGGSRFLGRGDENAVDMISLCAFKNRGEESYGRPILVVNAAWGVFKGLWAGLKSGTRL